MCQWVYFYWGKCHIACHINVPFSIANWTSAWFSVVNLAGHDLKFAKCQQQWFDEKNDSMIRLIKAWWFYYIILLCLQKFILYWNFWHFRKLIFSWCFYFQGLIVSISDNYSSTMSPNIFLPFPQDVCSSLLWGWYRVRSHMDHMAMASRSLPGEVL